MLKGTLKSPPKASHSGWNSTAARLRKLQPVPRRFYDRDPKLVAPELLGKILIRRHGRKLLAGRIVEVEAYLGQDDPASHAFRGATDRNRVMFGPPGFAYVYFTYGMHFCVNVTCLQQGTAGAVLIRAIEPLAGIEQMALNRDLNLSLETEHVHVLRALTSGPARLCEALAIDRARDDGKDLTSPKSDLWIASDRSRTGEIACGPRVGITQAADWPLRFYVVGNPFVSGPRASAPKAKTRK
jgi:DNA-3-methyladenine glycosylase